MLSMGQLTHLPESLAANPFHRLLVKFSRYKTGSFEFLFSLEAVLLRFSWLGLAILLALVLPPLEEVDYLSTAIRILTLLYPAMFMWSLTRISGVEMIQLMLEGHWTDEILASPMESRDLMLGFITPIWIVLRQYILISVFSLLLYELEVHVIVRINGVLYLEELIRSTIVDFSLFFSAVTWIIFIYLVRLLLEVRLRNGLIKGLFTVTLITIGVVLFIIYSILLFMYPGMLLDWRVLLAVNAMSALFIAFSIYSHIKLRRHFRRYLCGQLDLDMLIFDRNDPHASAWQPL